MAGSLPCKNYLKMERSSVLLSAMEKLRPKWDSVPMNHRSEHIPKVPHNNSVEEEYTSKKYIKVTHYCSVHTLIL